ncbi:hypothetical protein HDZ31DRAFT_65025 [Schizophyllum fasciatum]
MVFKVWEKCPLSGATGNLGRVKLIPFEYVDDVEDKEVACVEWVWGLKRGGLPYLLTTAHNSLLFRKDIADLYASFQFILVPTFKTYSDIMEFSKRSGVHHRDDNDKTPRRPLTALTPPNGLYRYVFLPVTDAARKLQEELDLQPQTEEDLAWGINTATQKPWSEGSEKFPVVECFAHPYGVCAYAERAFEYRHFRPVITAQWSICTKKIVDLWRVSTTHVPQWFIDSPDMDDDDITVADSEAAGYTNTFGTRASGDRPLIIYEDHETMQATVSGWIGGVDPDSKPEEQPPVPPSPIAVRRSERLKAKGHPYGSVPLVYPPLSPVRKAPWPSYRGADPIAYPPSWSARCGRFQTRRFSSNDWAYFHHSVALAAPTRHRARYLRRP